MPSSTFPMANIDREDSLSTIWSGADFSRVRGEFHKGLFPDECRNCQKVEKLGQLSRRQRILNRGFLFYGDREALNLVNTKEGKILELNISFSNKCNLKCAMCSSRYSHTWNSEEAEAKEAGIDFREGRTEVNFTMSNTFFESMLEEIDSAKHLMIKGGEPFIAPQTFKLLEYLKNRKAEGKSIPSIYIQTNGTVTSEKIASLISDLNIEIGVSIDGVGKSYEWIRGFSYERIEQNIKFFLDTVNSEPMSLDFTASIFNLFHIKEAFSKYLDLFASHPNFYKVNYTIARQPYNDLRALPLKLRQSVANELRQWAPCDKINDLENLCLFIESDQLELKKQKNAHSWLSFLENKRGPLPHREKYQTWLQEIRNV